MSVCFQSFAGWLRAQAGRDDWIGELARVAAGDDAWPAEADPDGLRAYLSLANAQGDQFEALDDAELEWLALRPRAIAA